MMFSYQDIRDMAVAGLGNKSITRQTITDFINAITRPPLFSLSGQEKEQLIDELQEIFNVESNIASSIEDETYEPWVHTVQADTFYSDRYKNFIKTKIPPNVINTMFHDSRYILDRLGNPHSERSFRRKGLVVGHVQSGKTANYTALINMAADYGYKLIIVIAGIHNNLRAQTQQRINEGFIGYDQASSMPVGVGGCNIQKQDIAKRPISLTSRQTDFSKVGTQNLLLSPENANVPIVLVIKKNGSVLRNLQQWLRDGGNQSQQLLLNYPTLIIDDEADYASINTNDPDRDPTAINRLLRETMKLFHRVAYVGYTATPFANIFIDADANDKKLGDDLFPEHFIVNLDTPSNYYGPAAFFLSEGESSINDRCIIIDDYESHIPIPIKDHPIVSLPPSLKDAIMCFFIAMVIKEIRKPNEHCSMLINLSHKKIHHKIVSDLTEEFVEGLKRTIRFEAAKDNAVKKSKLLFRLNEVFNLYFSHTKLEFDQVLKKLIDMHKQVVVRQIHSGSLDVLDYENYKSTGLKVIAIGGYSLSRGYTLEGLTISYLLRNSLMSDTLLQLGRWFGYREGYFDLCRVFLPEKSYFWYEFITQATEELRNEFGNLRTLNMTPKEYGLKVRSSPAGLLITAKNKMLHASRVEQQVSFSLTQFSLPQLLLETEQIVHNHKAVDEFLQSLAPYQSSWHSKVDNKDVKTEFFYSAVPASQVVNFLKDFNYVDKDDIALCLSYIQDGVDAELANWDVALVSSNNINLSKHMINNKSIQSARRKFHKESFEAKKVHIADGGGRIMRPWEEVIGLSEYDLKQAEELQSQSKVKQSAVYYRHCRKRPLLFIRLMDIFQSQLAVDKTEMTAEIVAEGVVGFAMSFPKSATERSVTYYANMVYMNQLKKMYGFDDNDIETEEE